MFLNYSRNVLLGVHQGVQLAKEIMMSFKSFNLSHLH